MLSVEECKKYLPKDVFTDDQIVEIRDSLYQLAGIAVEDFFAKKICAKNEAEAI